MIYMTATMSWIRKAASFCFKRSQKKNDDTCTDLSINLNGYEPLESDMLFTDCTVFPGNIVPEEAQA
jgi:hypothetical protein